MAKHPTIWVYKRRLRNIWRGKRWRGMALMSTGDMVETYGNTRKSMMRRLESHLVDDVHIVVNHQDVHTAEADRWLDMAWAVDPTPLNNKEQQ